MAKKEPRAVYRVEQDFSKFKFFVESSARGPSMFDLNGPIGKKWKPPKVEIDISCRKKGTAGDFWNFGGPPLVINERAKGVLLDLLQDVAELLPLPFEKEMYYVVNVTRVVDCIDHKRTKWQGEDEIEFDEPYFDSKRLGSWPLFVTPEHTGLIYAQDNFRNAVESTELKGLLFREVWRQGKK